jgi:hypothetical protein
MALVFPRVKPLGTSSVSSRKAVGNTASFPTEAMDYLKIDIFDSRKTSPYNYVGSGAGTGRSKGKSKESIFLYLPANLSEQYTTKYNQVGLGAAGIAGTQMFQQGNTQDAGTMIAQAAEQGKTQIAGNVAASAMNIANMGNSNITANDLAALAKRAIMNPYEETTFQGVDYRTHTFQFKLVPRGPQDVVAITKIIQSLRVSMLPGTSGGGDAGGNDVFSQIDAGTGRGDRWLTIPDFFQLSIVRYKGANETLDDDMAPPETLSFLMQFPTKCVLTNMSVNMTPDGHLNTLKNGDSKNDTYDYGPTAYELSLQFSETAFLTREMLR